MSAADYPCFSPAEFERRDTLVRWFIPRVRISPIQTKEASRCSLNMLTRR